MGIFRFFKWNAILEVFPCFSVKISGLIVPNSIFLRRNLFRSHYILKFFLYLFNFYENLSFTSFSYFFWKNSIFFNFGQKGIFFNFFEFFGKISIFFNFGQKGPFFTFFDFFEKFRFFSILAKKGLFSLFSIFSKNLDFFQFWPKKAFFHFFRFFRFSGKNFFLKILECIFRR